MDTFRAFPSRALLLAAAAFAFAGCLSGEDGKDSDDPGAPLVSSVPYLQERNAIVLPDPGPEVIRWCDGDELDSMVSPSFGEIQVPFELKADSLLLVYETVYYLGLAGMERIEAHVRVGAGQALEGRWRYLGDVYRPDPHGTPNAEQIAYFDSLENATRAAAERFPRFLEFKDGKQNVYSAKTLADSLLEAIVNQSGGSFVTWFDTSYYAITPRIVNGNTVELSGRNTGSQRVRLTLSPNGDLEISSNDAAVPKATIHANPSSCPDGDLPDWVLGFLIANVREEG